MLRVGALKQVGGKVYCHATGEEPELERLRRQLRPTERTISIKRDARGLHLDLNAHQRELALQHGAVEEDQAVTVLD